MTPDNDPSRLETLAKLAQSRAEIRRVLEPPHASHASRRVEDREHADHEGETDPRAGAFPRSRTMRLLLSGRGLSTVGAVVGGLIMARPALAFRLVRLFPTGAVARMLMVKALTAFRSRH